jgi:hypothetical protein
MHLNLKFSDNIKNTAMAVAHKFYKFPSNQLTLTHFMLQVKLYRPYWCVLLILMKG